MNARADLEEVMHFDPEEGITDLDVHLDRLAEAAKAQGFVFDRHGARNEPGRRAALLARRRSRG